MVAIVDEAAVTIDDDQFCTTNSASDDVVVVCEDSSSSRRCDTEGQSSGKKQALNRWGYYPLIVIVSWMFGTINNIHDFIDPGHQIPWLSVLDVGMGSLMGLFNSIAYGLNSSVRRAIYERLDLLPERFRRWFPGNLKS